MHAPDAQAAGGRTMVDAANYAIRACLQLFGIFLDPNASSKGKVAEEALPPGILRAVLKEEWGNFLGQKSSPWPVGLVRFAPPSYASHNPWRCPTGKTRHMQVNAQSHKNSD